MRDAPAAGQRGTGTLQRRSRLRRDPFLFHWSQGQRACQRFHHHFQQIPHSVELPGRQQIQQRMRLLAFLTEIRFYGFFVASTTTLSIDRTEKR
jgi:hypothetical protein